jgi:hypothetical protein
VLWALGVGGGVFALMKHGASPGRAAAADIKMGPPKSATTAPDKMTLVMFLHPKCPCSRASVAELSELMGRFGGRLQATVIVYQPGSEPPDWSRTGTIADASNIPGVVVRSDVDAVIARRYGAQTSGQVFLYDPFGKLAFSGGITAARGHVGDNDGLETVINIVTGQVVPATPLTGGPVFGCPIYSAEDDAPAMTNKGQR